MFRGPNPALPVLRTLALLALILLFCALQGCASNPWEQNYEGASAGPLPQGASAQLREVSWDRLQSGLQELEAKQASSDIHPADWPPEKQAEFNARLLTILQVSENPAQIEILGRSSFRTTDQRFPGRDTDLTAFARRIGADRVVWSRRLVGRTEQIVQEPVTTFGATHGWGRRGSVFAGSATTWVPIVVQADEYAYVAYFLRMQP